MLQPPPAVSSVLVPGNSLGPTLDEINAHPPCFCNCWLQQGHQPSAMQHHHLGHAVPTLNISLTSAGTTQPGNCSCTIQSKNTYWLPRALKQLHRLARQGGMFFGNHAEEVWYEDTYMRNHLVCDTAQLTGQWESPTSWLCLGGPNVPHPHTCPSPGTHSASLPEQYACMHCMRARASSAGN
jgi:hypothetical protein